MSSIGFSRKNYTVDVNLMEWIILAAFWYLHANGYLHVAFPIVATVFMAIRVIMAIIVVALFLKEGKE